MTKLIKEARLSDAPTVHRLMVEAFEEYRNLEIPSSAVNEPLSLLQSSLLSGSEHAIICFVDETPLGSLRYKVENEAIYFSRVSVPPQARGKGIAKAMLSWLEDFAKISGKSEMRCRVRTSLPKNISLYESVGFTIYKEELVTNPNGSPVQTDLMKKEII
ncbi:GNAT family N-acetyltransferase [Neobacillus rhizosphaerae]|uniref:GNAT family N-acetyltransferase n=1 Tax=Neobacillus rhizosphaerae TaxID=2880965 RepID=UPI003D2E56D9